MSGLVILVPPGESGEPTNWDVSTGGPPDGPQLPTTAVATWDNAISVSWFHTRTFNGFTATGHHYWTLVIDAINEIHAPPFDHTGPRSSANNLAINGNPHAGVSLKVHPQLGITLITLHGLDQAAVVVVAGAIDEPPTNIRLLPVAPEPTPFA